MVMDITGLLNKKESAPRKFKETLRMKKEIGDMRGCKK